MKTLTKSNTTHSSNFHKKEHWMLFEINRKFYSIFCAVIMIWCIPLLSEAAEIGWDFSNSTEPVIVSPASRSTLSGTNEEFRWKARGLEPVTQWWMYVGTYPGGADIWNSGSLATSLSTTVPNLPTNGNTVYVRLYYRTHFSGWKFIDDVYVAASVPEIVSPPPGATIFSCSEIFHWVPYRLWVTEWWIYVGKSKGSSDIWNSGSLGTQQSTALPICGTNGLFYVRLWYKVNNGGWQYIDAEYYKAAGV